MDLGESTVPEIPGAGGTTEVQSKEPLAIAESTEPLDDGGENGANRAGENLHKKTPPARPKVLDTITPIAPPEQRALLPKKKAKAKAKAEPKPKAKTGKGKDSKNPPSKSTTKKSSRAGAKETKENTKKKKNAKDEKETVENEHEEKDSDAGRKRRKKTCPTEKTDSKDTPASSSDGVSPRTTDTTADSAKAAAKKRISRKSAAYHKAKKTALSDGLTEEEAKEKAKEVPSHNIANFDFIYIHLYLPSFWIVHAGVVWDSKIDPCL